MVGRDTVALEITSSAPENIRNIIAIGK